MGYLLERLSGLAILLTILTLITLGLSEARDGSAAEVLAGQRASEAELAMLAEQLGENRSFLSRFSGYLISVVTFDFGETVKGNPVITELQTAFKYTFILALSAAVFSLIYGLGLGILSDILPATGRSLYRMNYFFLSTPIFILAILLIWVAALYLQLLPPGGTEMNYWYVLPAIALGLRAGPRLFLFTDEFLEREEKEPYIQTHRAYGSSALKLSAFFKLKNIILPVLSFWMLDFASYLAGAAIIETIFAIPGIGRLLLLALYSYDLNLIMGILVSTSLIIFLTGITQEMLDRYYRRFSQ